MDKIKNLAKQLVTINFKLGEIMYEKFKEKAKERRKPCDGDMALEITENNFDEQLKSLNDTEFNAVVLKGINFNQEKMEQLLEALTVAVKNKKISIDLCFYENTMNEAVISYIYSALMDRSVRKLYSHIIHFYSSDNTIIPTCSKQSLIDSLEPLNKVDYRALVEASEAYISLRNGGFSTGSKSVVGSTFVLLLIIGGIVGGVLGGPIGVAAGLGCMLLIEGTVGLGGLLAIFSEPEATRAYMIRMPSEEDGYADEFIPKVNATNSQLNLPFGSSPLSKFGDGSNNTLNSTVVLSVGGGYHTNNAANNNN